MSRSKIHMSPQDSSPPRPSPEGAVPFCSFDPLSHQTPWKAALRFLPLVSASALEPPISAPLGAWAHPHGGAGCLQSAATEKPTQSTVSAVLTQADEEIPSGSTFQAHVVVLWVPAVLLSSERTQQAWPPRKD